MPTGVIFNLLQVKACHRSGLPGCRERRSVASPALGFFDQMCLDHFLLPTMLGGWCDDLILQLRKLRLRSLRHVAPKDGWYLVLADYEDVRHNSHPGGPLCPLRKMDPEGQTGMRDRLKTEAHCPLEKGTI